MQKVEVREVESRKGLVRGVLLLLLLAVAEKLFLLHVDAGWFPDWVNRFRGTPLFLGLTLAFFGRKQFGKMRVELHGLSYGAAGLHVTTMALFLGLARYLRAHPERYHTGPHTALAALCAALMGVALFSLVATLLRVQGVLRAGKSLGIAWVYAGVCTAVLTPAREISRMSWDLPSSPVSVFLQHACFAQTSAVLQHFYRYVYVDASQQVLGTRTFVVRVEGLCSGIENLTLVLLLLIAWLIFDRRTLRLHRALLMIPLALGLSWLLNVLRLTALIAIGSSGHPHAAMRGFHEQAGWIALNFASLAGLWFVQRVRWFHKAQAHESPDEFAGEAGSANPSILYLAPFAAILAASMISQALSSGFERLYPLRLLAAILMFWVFRDAYRKLDWSFGATGPLAGLAVGLMWIGMSLLRLRYGIGPAPSTAAVYVSPRDHLLWIAVRVASAVITVPVAEELAFRGFLARRVVSERFEEVSYRALSGGAIAISSIAFGLMHGHLWMAGTVAGVVFAVVARVRGRLGEAVAAHAVANLVVAALVLARGDYSLW